jgi:hypothetical protein
LSFPPLWRFFVPLFVSAFVFNWLWEMWQMSAYVEMAGRSWRETALACMLASVGDAFITLLVYAIGALATWNLRWALKGGWRVYLLAALLGDAVGIYRAHAESAWYRSLAATATHAARARRIVGRRVVVSAFFNRRYPWPRPLVVKFSREYR